MGEQLVKTIKELLNLLLLVITILLINLFWITIKEPYHYFFLIGYFLVGMFWNRKVF